MKTLYFILFFQIVLSECYSQSEAYLKKLSDGSRYSAQGNYAAAIKSLTEAIDLDPNDTRAYNNRGNVHYEKGDYAAAIKDYTEALKLDPKSSWAASTYTQRGRLKALLKNYEGARSDYTEAIKIQPKDEMAYFYRGELSFTLGEYEKAISDYTESIRLEDRQVLFFLRRGRAYVAVQQYKHAANDFARVLEHTPDHSEAHYFKGLAELKLGNSAAACNHLRNAKESYEKDALMLIKKHCL